MTKQKIILVIGSASIGGAEKQVIKLASEFNLRNYHCHIIFLTKGGPLEHLAQDLNIDYHVAGISKLRLHKTVVNIFKLIKFIKNQGPATYYLFLPHAILFLDHIARLFSPSSKIVFGIRGSIFRKNNLLYKLYRNKLRKSRLVICNSVAIHQELRKIRNNQAGQIKVIHNGVDSNPYLKPFMFSDSEKQKVVVVSNFHPYKGHDLLIEALNQIESVSLEVTLIGDGVELAKIFNDTISIQKHKFNFLGQIENVSEILANHDFAIHPSRTEGLSNAILEELSAGLPVVAFNVGGNFELISNGCNGYLVQSGNTKAMAIKIEMLALDSTLRRQMSAEALASVDNFSWQKNIDAHVKFFTD